MSKSFEHESNHQTEATFCERCVYSRVNIQRHPCVSCYGTLEKPYFELQRYPKFKPEDIVDMETE